jgi:dTDP-4-dehydrorhamnose 3,5-epimerase
MLDVPSTSQVVQCQPRVTETGISGALLFSLQTHEDERGKLIEIFREAWHGMPSAVQWNCNYSQPGALRGIRGHLRHWDYIVVAAGMVLVGLKDLRPYSTTRNKAILFPLGPANPQALIIPPGVAHGFYFPEAAVVVQGVSEYWDQADELGCRWDDPELGLSWPEVPTLISEQDASMPSLSVFARQMEEGLQKDPI